MTFIRERSMIEYLRHLVRFSITGLVTAMSYFTISFLFVAFLYMRPSFAGLVSFILVLPLNYILHKIWSFRSSRLHRAALPRFIFVVVMGLVINSSVIEVLTQHTTLYFLVTQFIAVLVVIAWNYIMLRFLVFPMAGRARA